MRTFRERPKKDDQSGYGDTSQRKEDEEDERIGKKE
jgi:hypothetical protein